MKYPKSLFLILVLTLFPLALSARKDEMVREYLTPVRIVWSAGSIENAPCLLSTNSGQSVLGNKDCCTLVSHPSQKASVLFDFGKEMHGGLEIITGQFASGKPVRVRIRFGESVSEAMNDISEESGATNDHAVRDFEALLPWLGTMEYGNTGFRFVRIDVLDDDVELTLKEVNAIHIYRDLEYRGSFVSDNNRLNDIWMTAAYTVHQNMQTYIWDGIKRDRLVWVGDMHPEVMAVNNVFGAQEVVHRSLDYARDATPLPAMMNGMNAYSLWWLIIHRDLYLYQGDLDYLKSQREYLCGLVDVLLGKIDEDGRDLFDDYFLDWPSRADKNASHAGFHALFIMAMEAAATICDAIGETDAALKSVEGALRLRKAAPLLVDRFFMENMAPDAPGRKQAVALMCLADLIDTDTALGCLLHNGASGFSTFYGYYMLEALAKCGSYSDAMQICSDFWGGMLDLGATTFWEDFDIRWKENAARIDEITPQGKIDVHKTYGGYCYVKLRHSLAHGWSSGPSSWMTRHISGLYPLEPGGTQVAIDPHMECLNHIEASLPVSSGIVRVTLDKLPDGRIQCKASAPSGVTLIPSASVSLVEE